VITIFPFGASSCQMPASVRRLRSPRSRRAFLSRVFCGSMRPSEASDVSLRLRRQEEHAESLSQADRRSSIFSRCRRARRIPRSRALQRRAGSAPWQDPDKRNAAFQLAVLCRAKYIECGARSRLLEYRAYMSEFAGRAPWFDRVRAASPLQGPCGSDLITHQRIHALIVLPAPRPAAEDRLRIYGSGRC